MCGRGPTDDGIASGVSGLRCVDSGYPPYDYAYAASRRQIVADTEAGATNTIDGHAPYLTDLSDAEWHVVQPSCRLGPALGNRGRKTAERVRASFESILYVLTTRCR